MLQLRVTTQYTHVVCAVLYRPGTVRTCSPRDTCGTGTCTFLMCSEIGLCSPGSLFFISQILCINYLRTPALCARRNGTVVIVLR